MKTKHFLKIWLAVLWAIAWVPAFAAIPIDRRVTVQPILVAGSMPAPDWFEAETDKIWAQAGIDVKFLPLATYVNSSYIVIDGMTEITNFFQEAGGRSDDPSVINVWFTRELSLGGIGGTVTGYTQSVGSNLIIISKYSIDNHLVDTCAHELGHALGLDHLDDPADPMSGYLMSSVLMGTDSIGDIYPDGLQQDKLTLEEIALAPTSSYVKSINPYRIMRSVVASGGGQSAGGTYVLTGTIGQPDAGYHDGGPYELLGGFRVGGPLCIVNLEDFAHFAADWLDGPCNEDNDWCNGADLNHANDVDILDLRILANYWLNICPFNWPLE